MVTKGPDEMTSDMRSNGCRCLAQPVKAPGEDGNARRLLAAGWRNGPPFQVQASRG
jgi:hypothetical protein